MGLASKLNAAAGPASTGTITANQHKASSSSLNLGIFKKKTVTVDNYSNAPPVAGAPMPAPPPPYTAVAQPQPIAMPPPPPVQYAQPVAPPPPMPAPPPPQSYAPNSYPSQYPASHPQQSYHGGMVAPAPQPPQQQYAPAPYVDPYQSHQHARYTGPYRGDLITNLRRIVAANQLQCFYDDYKLQQMAGEMAARLGQAAPKIESAFGIPGLSGDIQSMDDVAVFAAVGLYDVVLYVDDSGSMEYYNPQDGRKDDLNVLVNIIANIVTVYDDDGISLRFFNSNIERDGIRTTADVQSAISQVKFNGMTPLGTNLDRRVIQPHIVGPARSNQLRKPVLVIILTDGQPEGEEGNNPRKVFDVIRNCKTALSSSRYGPGSAEFQFVQLGKDQGAQKFLGELDRDPVIGEMVDCTSSFEMEAEEFRRMGNELEVGHYVYKLLTGSIDPNMDHADG
ncbi:hypothetical protein DFJ74DRAFT_647570 [Hyaloraphidium curvatum]|nr:hypothetical protein DFJ74DRAFT_647570 [Hyaloraphidium curvatum]